MDGTFRRFLSRQDICCKTIPVDTQVLAPPVVAATHAVPVLVHAPNHRNVKGTAFLLDSLEDLRKVGIAFDLRMVENADQLEAIEIYRQADIIADQFVIKEPLGFLRSNAWRWVGSGFCVCLDHEHLCNPLFNLPIVNSNRFNLTRVLAVLLKVPELRTRLGAEGRDAAVKYQSLEDNWGTEQNDLQTTSGGVSLYV